jgi:hypothetical protein
MSVYPALVSEGDDGPLLNNWLIPTRYHKKTQSTLAKVMVGETKLEVPALSIEDARAGRALVQDHPQFPVLLSWQSESFAAELESVSPVLEGSVIDDHSGEGVREAAVTWIAGAQFAAGHANQQASDAGVGRLGQHGFRAGPTQRAGRRAR